MAIQCLCWVLKMDLPSVRLKIKEITVDLFSVLHKYACAGLSNKGDNYDLVMITFKVGKITIPSLDFCLIIKYTYLKC